MQRHGGGDLHATTTFAHWLPPTVYVSQLTPWGITFGGGGGRTLGCIDSLGRGRFWVSLALPYGVRSRAAARRAGDAMRWFQTNHSPDWAVHGFTDVTAAGTAPIGSGKHRRWTIRLLVRFAAADRMTTQLAWASTHELIKFE